MCYFLLFESSYKISNILYPLMQREKFYFTGTHLSAVRLPFREKLIELRGNFGFFRMFVRQNEGNEDEDCV